MGRRGGMPAAAALQADDSGPELQDLPGYVDPPFAVDAQHEPRWPADRVPLADHPRERERGIPGEEPPAEVGAGRTGGGIFRDCRTLPEAEASTDLVFARVGEPAR